MATRAALVLAASVIGMTLSAMPAVVRAEAAGDDWLPSQQHGMGFAKDPSGAVITRVTKNSAAERAGVTEGMVITHIDGLPLRELTAIQIARIFAGTGARVELKVRGNGTLIVNDTGGFRDGGSALKLGPAGN